MGHEETCFLFWDTETCGKSQAKSWTSLCFKSNLSHGGTSHHGRCSAWGTRHAAEGLLAFDSLLWEPVQFCKWGKRNWYTDSILIATQFQWSYNLNIYSISTHISTNSGMLPSPPDWTNWSEFRGAQLKPWHRSAKSGWRLTYSLAPATMTILWKCVKDCPKYSKMIKPLAVKHNFADCLWVLKFYMLVSGSKSFEKIWVIFYSNRPNISGK